MKFRPLDPRTRWAQIRSGAFGENNVKGLRPVRPDAENLVTDSMHGNRVLTSSLGVWSVERGRKVLTKINLSTGQELNLDPEIFKDWVLGVHLVLVSCFMDSSGIGLLSCCCWEVRLVESYDLHLDKMVQGPRGGCCYCGCSSCSRSEMGSM